jgi:hypothetical protein
MLDQPAISSSQTARPGRDLGPGLIAAADSLRLIGGHSLPWLGVTADRLVWRGIGAPSDPE